MILIIRIDTPEAPLFFTAKVVLLDGDDPA